MYSCYFFILFLLVQSNSRIFGQSHIKSETIHLNGIDFHYQVNGEGDPLLLLHGWTQSSAYWKSYIPSLAGDYQVYALDLRGHGQTTPLSKDFSIKKATEDVLIFINHLNLKKVKAIGVSFGGIVLLEICHSNPDAIEAMAIIGASYDYSGRDNPLAEEFKFKNLDADYLNHLRQLHSHGDDQIKAMFNPKLDYEVKLTEEELCNITTRTLVIHGDRDEIIGIDTPFELYKSLPNASLWIVPSAGHIPVSGKNQSEFLRVVKEFFESDH